MRSFPSTQGDYECGLLHLFLRSREVDDKAIAVALKFLESRIPPELPDNDCSRSLLRSVLNRRDSNGRTPLLLALRHPSIFSAIVSWLLRHPSLDVSFPGADGSTAAHRLARSNTPSVALPLLKRIRERDSAALSARDANGRPPLLLARNRKVAEFLLEVAPEVSLGGCGADCLSPNSRPAPLKSRCPGVGDVAGKTPHSDSSSP